MIEAELLCLAAVRVRKETTRILQTEPCLDDAVSFSGCVSSTFVVIDLPLEGAHQHFVAEIVLRRHEHAWLFLLVTQNLQVPALRLIVSIMWTSLRA